MQTVLLVVLAALAGMILPMQPGINSMLQSKLGSAWVAALVSFTVGTLILLATVALLRVSANPNILPDLPSIRSAPWWAWLGGLIGAIFVSSSIVLAPKLGAVLFVGAVVFGQMFSSVLLDQFGAVGYAKQSVNPGRLAGVLLILIGVAMILKFSPKPQSTPPDPEPAAAAPQASPSPTPAAPNT